MRRVLACAFPFLVACSHEPPPQAWPAGEYCVLRDAERCPKATNGVFEEGQIVIDNDNGMMLERSHGSSRRLEDNDNDGLLSLEVCCGSFEDTGEAFPNESFVVLAGGSLGAIQCPAGFTPGSVFIDAEDSEFLGDEADSYIAGNVGATTIEMNRNVDIAVCESGPNLGGVAMPDAWYCVIGGRGGCPEGFSSGSITSFDETSGNKNELTGTIGGITQLGAETNFPVCCY
jgi:hypothetical protein